tara:strand:+ start:14839 stop:16503 length:1665 start_codon:yes stop_codon:yes gene_type:complete
LGDEHVRQYIERLATDFEFFLEELWEAIGLPPIAEHQREIARWLQAGPNRRGVRAFRGASKTFVTLGYALWRLFVNNDERVLVISKSEKHSKDSLFMVRKWISTVPWLQHLTPDRKGGQRDSATKFDIGPASNDRTASFTAASITGQITGSRASLIIGDDISSMQNSMTYEMRERLRTEVTELDNIIIPGGDVIFLGTPFHQECLYDKLAESGYEFRCWPARLPAPDEMTDDLAPELLERLQSGEEPGTPVWPDRFDDEELKAREASEGRSLFAMQYMLLTKLTDGLEYPLKLSDLIVFPVQPESAPMQIAWGQMNDRGGTTRLEEIPSLGFGTDGFYAPIMYSQDWTAYSSVKMWVDPSGRGADRTGYAVGGYVLGKIYLMEVGGLVGGYSSDTLHELATIAKRCAAREIYVEDNFGQGMFVELFRPILHRLFTEDWGAAVNTVRVTGQKELRLIAAAEPLFNQHRVVISPEIAHNQELQKQITRLTRQRNCLKHDDEVEAMCMLLKQFEDVVAVDPDINAHRRREEARLEELAEHYQAMGMHVDAPRWFEHH